MGDNNQKERMKKVELENQKLRVLFNEVVDISKEIENFEIKEEYHRLDLTYHLNKHEYVQVYSDSRGRILEPTIRFRTSQVFITSRKWFPLFSKKTTSEKVLKVILKLKETIYRKQELEQNNIKKQDETIVKIKKDLGSNTFKIRALCQPNSIFQKFDIDSISNNCELILEPSSSYDNKYTIRFKIDNVKDINLENVITELVKLELM